MRIKCLFIYCMMLSFSIGAQEEKKEIEYTISSYYNENFSNWVNGAILLAGWRDNVIINHEEVTLQKNKQGYWSNFTDPNLKFYEGDRDAFMEWGFNVSRIKSAAELIQYLNDFGPLWAAKGYQGVGAVIIIGWKKGNEKGKELYTIIDLSSEVNKRVELSYQDLKTRIATINELLIACSCPLTNTIDDEISTEELTVDTLFQQINLEGKLDKKIFEFAMQGYKKNTWENANVISIIDFSQPSTANRLYIIDLKNKKLLYQTLVSHGNASGGNYAKNFSNVKGSNKSSLGFYKTAETYRGKHGYSLNLDGLENGFNNLARKRRIVMHKANYVSDDFIKKNKRLGRSNGCPAIKNELQMEIIDLVKDGSCLFIYAEDKKYLEGSTFLTNK